MSQKTKTKTCENCHYFDDSKHRHDERTKCAGICQKFYNVQFKKDKACNFFIEPDGHHKEWSRLTEIEKNPIINQLQLF